MARISGFYPDYQSSNLCALTISKCITDASEKSSGSSVSINN